ncbi:MAG TPA: carboxypeptidase-like regulatory domain-containing protein, partial [Ignavibacteria bacterium]|nr:carboxypeptidase-like regulatory domain-containing protein [Ignavibacteria bacterium]
MLKSLVFTLILTVFAFTSVFSQTDSTMSSLSGTIIEENSTPLQGINIDFINSNGSKYQRVSGADGRFSVELSPGTYTITIEDSKYLFYEISDFILT